MKMISGRISRSSAGSYYISRLDRLTHFGIKPAAVCIKGLISALMLNDYDIAVTRLHAGKCHDAVHSGIYVGSLGSGYIEALMVAVIAPVRADIHSVRDRDRPHAGHTL